MSTPRIAPIVLATVLAALPLSLAKAQYYPACNPFPLSWPFCIVGAAVGTAAAIATAPFRAVSGPYYTQPYYPAAYYRAAGHEPWNRPSPSDHVANRLNRAQLTGY